jgi:hypothetical protein
MMAFAKRVTLDSLPTFKPLLKTAATGDQDDDSGDDVNQTRQSAPPDPDLQNAEAQFSGQRQQVNFGFVKPVGRRSASQPGTATPATQPVTQATPSQIAKGPLLWRKKLRDSDVQRQAGKPTGGVRMTQAKWKASDGNVIDQLSYFRHTVFGRFNWSGKHIGRKRNFREETAVLFDITAAGFAFGVRALKVSDMQSRAAGQGNYTTMLHWTGITAKIKELNLTGKTFSLYGPATGTTQPYSIEIA